MDSSGLRMGSRASKRVTTPVSVIASSAEKVVDVPTNPCDKYQVFISFRGKDTRYNFTSHLYDALRRKKIKTFIDDRLNRGEEISSTIRKTIQGSEIYVIIFSKDYASSSWCLDELVEILEWKKRFEKLVIPIFYNIDPFDVRRQTGSYADSFAKHTNRLKNDMHKVLKWKDALTQASNLSGFDSAIIRPETELIRKIVKDILRKLKSSSPYDLDGLVGIHDHISAVESFLNIGSQDVRIVGIWGMGGIGKTTIAEAIFHKLQPEFESCSFVPSVQKQLGTNVLDHVRDKYLQELLEEEDIGKHSIRSHFVKKLLQQRKVLLVLDDINESNQTEDLIRGRDWFGPGSRIIITTRDVHVLRIADADEVYHVKEMSFNDALQLFNIKAFKQGIPVKDYLEFSKQAVDYCKGVPLALKVLGSFLYGRTKRQWESAFTKLQNSPPKGILDVLKLSYDGLDENEKEIFLDIALFHDGNKKESVKDLLDNCGFSADIGISILMERSLISIRWDTVEMHDLLKAMGQEIVCRLNAYKSSTGRRRLCKHEDICNVLKKKQEGEEIYGISLDASKIKDIDLMPNTFENMNNLKILKFYNPQHDGSSKVHIPNGVGNLPEELSLLRWDGYPLTSMSLNSCAFNIVQLHMPRSNLKRLWDDNQHLPNLKSINLCGSEQLTEIPDLSVAPNIRHLNVSFCTRLSRVSSSNNQSNLQSFDIIGCDALKTISLGGNTVERRSWRLLAEKEIFILSHHELCKVSIRILKSDSSNTYILRFNYLPVTSTDLFNFISLDPDRTVLVRLLFILKRILPNLKVFSLLDKLSSLESLSEHLDLKISCSRFSPLEPLSETSVLLLSTHDEFVEPTENWCSSCTKGTRNKGADVSSWDWEEDLIGADNIYICNCRLSRIPSNDLRCACLTEVSLQTDILTLLSSIHAPSWFMSDVQSFDNFKRTRLTELTFSLDSENVTDISLNLAQERSNHMFDFLGNEWPTTFSFARDTQCGMLIITLLAKREGMVIDTQEKNGSKTPEV